jgi:GT2 family glycosyltransferase
MLDDVGLFDEAFFAYCEDADLGFRARLRGWRCIYVPTAVVYHKFSASSEAFSAFKALHVERNRIWLAVKNLPLPLLLLSPWFTTQRYFWQAYGALVGRGASGRFVAQGSRALLLGLLAKAYWQALAGLPRVLGQRRAIQRRRRASTREVRDWMHRFGIGARRIALME